jgi:hypothetical protein
LLLHLAMKGDSMGKKPNMQVQGNQNAVVGGNGNATVNIYSPPPQSRWVRFLKIVSAMIILAFGTIIGAFAFQLIFGPFLLEGMFGIHIGIPWLVVGGVIGFVGMLAELMGIKPRSNQRW